MGIPVIEADNICGNGLDVTIYFNNPMEEHTRKEFEKLITGWYTVGVYGGFSGYMHDLSKVWIEGTEAGFTVDMGSAEQVALDTLIHSLEGFSETNGIVIVRVVLGTEVEST